jgi:hypothetical protein
MAGRCEMNSKSPFSAIEKIPFVGWKAGRKLQLKERWTPQLLLKKRLSPV